MHFTIIWWDLAGNPHQKGFEFWAEAVDYEMGLLHAGYTTSGVLGDSPPPHIGDDLPF